MCEELKVVVFDMDGVLIKWRSSWRVLHQYFNSLDIVEERNDAERFQRGEISYREWMARDLQAILKATNKPVTKEDLLKVFSNYELEEGVEELVKVVKGYHLKTAIVSGGIDLLAELIRERLGLDMALANKLTFSSDGYLLPEGVEVVNPLRKSEVLTRISKELNIPLSKFMFIGDSLWDLEAMNVVGHPVFVLKDEGIDLNILKNVFVVKSLRELIPYINRICSKK